MDLHGRSKKGPKNCQYSMARITNSKFLKSLYLKIIAIAMDTYTWKS